MKRLKWTRIVSGLLAIALVLGTVPTTVFAAEGRTCGADASSGSHSYSGDVCSVCGAVKISEVTFPDENFRSFIASQDYGKDGLLTSAELSSVTVVDVSYQNIQDLTGIEHFTALTYLDCLYNQLTTLDVRKNTALTYLNCAYNQLSSLDVSKNTALRQLYCYENQLTALDVSRNTALTELSLYSNQLTALNVSGNAALTALWCQSNQLTGLDVSKNPALEILWCFENQLPTLDVRANAVLAELSCHTNQLKSLDVSKNPALVELSCHSNQLKSLDVSTNRALRVLSCSDNQLTSLLLGAGSTLKYLECSYNQLTNLDVSGYTGLTQLLCNDNRLKYLNVNNNRSLTDLFCGNNQLTGLDVSNNSVLTTLSCGGNTRTVAAVQGKFDLRALAADGFDISRADNWKGGTVGDGILTATSDTVTYIYDLGNGQTETFTLRITEGMAAPTLKVSNVASTGKIKLTWEKVKGAAKYEVYRATSKTGTYSLLKAVTGTSLTNTSATTGKTYYYKIRAVAEDGTKSDWSSIVSRTCDLPQPAVEIYNVASTGNIRMTWEKIEGAKEYQIYRATAKDGTYKLMKTTTDTSYTNTSAEIGSTYYYKIRAIHSSSSANSAYSAIVSRTCDLAQPVVTITNVASSGKIKLTWEEVEGATEYKVYRATSKDGTYTLMKTTTSTSYTNTSAEAGKAYYYKVRAIHSNSAANSAYSAIVSRTCDLARPDVTVKLSSGKVKVTWDKVSGATEYKVYRATSKDGTYKLMKTTTGTSYTNTSVTSGKTYYYKVKAIHSKSAANSAYSSIDSIKVK